MNDEMDVLFEGYYADASEYLESDEDKEINEQLDNEMNNYYSDDLDYLNKEDLKRKLRKFNKLQFTKDDVNMLKRLALQKYGFINNSIRKKAWPLLIEYGNNDFDYTLISNKKIREHRYNKQVELDVVRTLKRFPPQISDDLRGKLQEKLINIICSVLIVNDKDNLNYYQGYHDICLTFLLVTGVSNCIPSVSSITQTHLKDFMERTMEKTIQLLANIMPLIDSINNDVAEHMIKADLDVAFALSWLITWYSHVLDDLKIILRLYDLFIASDPLMPIYLGAVIVCEKSSEILETECDMASLYSLISKLPARMEHIEMFESLIKKALILYTQYPPECLPKLIEKWKIKSKNIQDEKLENERLDRLRFRGKQHYNEENETTAITRRKLNNNHHKSLNKYLMGVLTIGVAAATAYALTTNPKEPEDILMKFFHLFSYK